MKGVIFLSDQESAPKIQIRDAAALQKKLLEKINDDPKPARIMHICGTHERTISKYGIRSLLSKDIEGILVDDLASENIQITATSIENIDFTDAFTDAVEAKQVAEQNALREKNNTVRIQEEANQQIIKAEAEAKAIQIKADALAANPKIVSYEAVQRWNGVLPEYMLGDAVPFINLK